ncbi:MAG: 50S ribosomal protein L4 [Synergistales bacterium]|nr:50S ribosomal protein L4 [Synergistales bacterium]
MPTVKLVNFLGEELGDFQLSDNVFGAPIHVVAMHQVVVAQLANQRQGTHSTKTRGEVSGGGRKPWRQKHTGRARHGSTRSPIWVGGGVVHGPKPRDYHQKVNKKVRKMALKSALSLKVQEAQAKVVDSFQLESPSTKSMVNFLNSIKAKKPLILVHETDARVIRSASNIQGAKVLHVDSINVYDLLNAESLILTPETVRKLEEVYSL